MRGEKFSMGEVNIDIDCKDISDSFKYNLRIENKLKSIDSIFFNERFSNRINYKPYFQRNYVWDSDKASYFIESILLETEIPPLVLFDNQKINEVIDGRQRYETIEKFINNRLVLTEDGLHVLKSLAGKTYSDLDEKIKEGFEDTKIRILQCMVANEPHLSEEKEDKIKKEIFRRYNSGIIPLHKEEIQRAEFIDDEITKKFNTILSSDKELLTKTKTLFLSKRQMKKGERDSINMLLAKIRAMLVLPNVPINNYANSSSKSDVIAKAYYFYRDNELVEEVKDFEKIINVLYELQLRLRKMDHILKDSILLYECLFWGITILIQKSVELEESLSERILEIFMTVEHNQVIWEGISVENRDISIIFQQTGSHYYKSILYRYRLVSNLFSHLYNIDFENCLNNTEHFKCIMGFENNALVQLDKFKIHKVDPTSMTIEDIMKKISKKRFVIRPNYQRSEVTNIGKASYLMESILLDMKIPPIYIYKRGSGVYEVIDGQQRLLTIMGFLGKTYLTENGEEEKSQKHLFKLKNLRILDELNGKNMETIPEKYLNKILDFQIDVVEIDSNQNENFDNIDLFLRLNTKPYPIRINSFEMWNAYVNKETVVNIKQLAEENEGKIFKKKDTRMSIEELITSLAYLDYKSNRGISPYSVLNIYRRNNRINARIKEKADITRVLANISSDTGRDFLDSISNVRKFIEKVWILINNEKEKIGYLFASLNLNGGKTDQNFYLLWLLLLDFSEEEINEKRLVIYEMIHSVFENAQDYNQDVEVFINQMKNFSVPENNDTSKSSVEFVGIR